MIIRSADLRFKALPGRWSADPFGDLGIQDLAMRIVEVEPGDRNPHLHPHSYEVMYVVSGRGIYWEAGTAQPVEAGDCILVPPNTPHVTVAGEGSVVRLACFFPSGDLASNIEELEETIRWEKGKT